MTQSLLVRICDNIQKTNKLATRLPLRSFHEQPDQGQHCNISTNGISKVRVRVSGGHNHVSGGHNHEPIARNWRQLLYH